VSEDDVFSKIERDIAGRLSSWYLSLAASKLDRMAEVMDTRVAEARVLIARAERDANKIATFRAQGKVLAYLAAAEDLRLEAEVLRGLAGPGPREEPK
jgi:hypothetical protein